MSLQRILLTSPGGPPDDPATWSGTPWRLLDAIRSDGRLEPRPWSSVLTGVAAQAARAADFALGLRHGFIHGPARRWLASRAASAEAARSGCGALLHLGTYDVPATADARHHYLYVDNTYDLWERQALAANVLSSHQRRWFRRLESMALGRLQHIFTAGQHVAANFMDVFGVAQRKISVVGTGLGGVRPYDGPKDYAAGRLLVVAKVRRHDKGLPLLLDAFSNARQTRPDLQLTVVGGEGFPGLAGRAGVTGTAWVDDARLQCLFEEAALYVMPATYEPWGLSYLEALACRTPVVGLARGALPEMTGDGRYGFLLDQPDPQALAALLLRALADPAALARMGLEGQQHCLARYRWGTIASRIADVITQDAAVPA